MSIRQSRAGFVVPALGFNPTWEELQAWATELNQVLNLALNDVVTLNQPPGFNFLREAAGLAMVWFGDSSEVPEGMLYADGSALNRVQYAELFKVIGTTYGVGDGTTTFNIPDQTDFPALANGVWVISS